MAKSFVFNPFTGNFDEISEVTLTAVGSTPNADGASVDGSQAITLQPADATHPGVITAADYVTFSGKQPAGNYITALTTDVAASGPGSVAATIQPNVVTNSKLAQMPTLTVKGNNTGGTANSSDLTVAQVNAILPVFTPTLNGLVPLSGGGTANFLRADGTFAAPPINGTVTSVSVTTANNVTGTVATATTTPAITLAPTSSTPTASSFVSSDANKNISANSFLEGYTTTATAAGTTTLVVGSTENQYFTGVTTQTVVLPVTSTLTLGQSFTIVNNSTGIVTVQSSGANTIQAMAAGTQLVATVILTSGTTAASWSVSYTSGIAAITAQTANYAVLATDQVVTMDATGGARTLTLPTAVSKSGQQFILKKIDSSVNTVQLLTTSAQTIEGNASGALFLATQYETLRLVSDGANWLILDHKCDGIWVAYTPTISAGFGTPTNVSFLARRVGDSLQVKGTLTTGTNTAALVTFSLPTWAPTISSAKTPVSNTTSAPGPQIGWWQQSGTSSTGQFGPLVTCTGTSTTLIYFGGNSTYINDICIPNAGNSVAQSNRFTTFSFEIPIANWFA